MKNLSHGTTSLAGMRVFGWGCSMYLRISQCLWIPSISLSNSCNVCCVCKTSPGRSLASTARASLTEERWATGDLHVFQNGLDLIHGHVALVEDGRQILREGGIGQELAGCAFALLDAGGNAIKARDELIQVLPGLAQIRA